MLIRQYSVAEIQYRKLVKVLCDIKDVAGYTPAVVGETAEWISIVSTDEDKALSGKTLFSTLDGTYGVTLNELNTLLKASTAATENEKLTQEEGFKEVWRRKWCSTTETTLIIKKKRGGCCRKHPH